MEMELKSLIDKIKKEGVEQAGRDADNIVAEAQEKAKKILADAEAQKAVIARDARAEAESFRKTSLKALEQSARDVLLTLRERVTEFFGRVAKEKVSDALTLDVLKDVIEKAVENFRKDKALDIEVLVSEADRDRLEKELFKSLQKKGKEYFELRGVPTIEKGFRIGEKGKESYYDFTDEALAEAFTRYLSPKLVEMLDIDLGLGKNNKNA